MKFKDFKRLVDSLIVDTDLFTEIGNKKTKSDYEQFKYKELKKSITLKEELLTTITGEFNTENFFKVKLSLLEKYLLPATSFYNLKYEISYQKPDDNFVSYAPFVDIRIVKKATDEFGDLYYHIEYLQNKTQPLDKENTYIILKPLFNPFMWNEICLKYDIKNYLWACLKEQLILDKRIERIENFKFNEKDKSKYFDNTEGLSIKKGS